MSDDTNTFANIWAKVFNQDFLKLLCILHVETNWVKKLNLKSEVDKFIYKDLKSLMLEPDVELFKCALNGFMFKVETENKEFYNYFKAHIVPRTEQWALCYRIESDINVNMYLENFHRNYKHSAMNGSVCTRIDKALFFLLKIIRDKSFVRLEKLLKNSKSYRQNLIKDSRISLQTIDKKAIEKFDKNLYAVKRFVCDGYYTVTVMITECSKMKNNKDFECNLLCTDCKICTHMCTCTCVNGTVGIKMCRHIHAVATHCNVQFKKIINPIINLEKAYSELAPQVFHDPPENVVKNVQTEIETTFETLKNS